MIPRPPCACCPCNGIDHDDPLFSCFIEHRHGCDGRHGKRVSCNRKAAPAPSAAPAADAIARLLPNPEARKTVLRHIALLADERDHYKRIWGGWADQAVASGMIADAAVTKLLAVRERVEAMRDDCTHHESKESSPAEIRTYKGWVNVDDYATDILDILDKEIR